MKRLMLLVFGFVALVLLAVLPAMPVFAQDSEPEFCWRDTTTRGVGEIPQTCGEGRERIGELCYSTCPANTQRFGFDCHSVCPAGMRDDGLFCRAEEYGRGAGYPWQIEDGFSNDGMFSRCQSDNGNGNCELDGAIVYPKCKPGYEKVGCCICRPIVPDCEALGMNPGVDLSCAKKITIGDPVPGVCGDGQEEDAGLCYPTCPRGYTGIGPVCWSGAPTGWVECGMGAAKDSDTCAEIITDQVTTVGELTLFVATLGSSSAATTGEKGATSASRLAKIKKTYDKLKEGYEAVKKEFPAIKKAEKSYEAANKGMDGYVALNTAVSAMTEEDMARAAAQMAAILDPSGASATVAAYTYPKCSKYGFLYELAHKGEATQSSVDWDGVPSIAIDGNNTDDLVTVTAEEENPWWQVDLGDSHEIDSITLWNRTDCCEERLSDFSVFVSDSDMTGLSYSDLLSDSGVWRYDVADQAPPELKIPVSANGRYVRVQLAGTNYLSLKEVEVWGK